jgi:hypothetical protein
MAPTILFGDATPDDAFDRDDNLIDWSRVAELAERVDMINAIHNAPERLIAARQLIAELDGTVL